MNYPLVLAGGGPVAVLRCGICTIMPTQLAYAFTLVSVVGGFAAGLLLGLAAAGYAPAAEWRLFLSIGPLGSFTTFSAFSSHVTERPPAANCWLALWHICLNVFLCLLGALLGFWLSRMLYLA